jgi:protein SCO1
VSVFPARVLFLSVAVAAALIGVGFTFRAIDRDEGAFGSSVGGGGTLPRTASHPIARPDFTLLDTRGRRFDFRAETEGRVALLFFGYTRCPDVCPVHLSNLAEVLRDLRYEDRERIRVVFVTVDPVRDTPERIRAWLDGFDPRFTGLRGSTDEVNEILAAVDLPAIPTGAIDGRRVYDVGHAAAVLAFGPEGPLRASYPLGTRQTEWARDLPALLRERPLVSRGHHDR